MPIGPYSGHVKVQLETLWQHLMICSTNNIHLKKPEVKTIEHANRLQFCDELANFEIGCAEIKI